MDRIGHQWNRYQWVADQGKGPAPLEEVMDNPTGNLSQWISARSDGSVQPAWQPPAVPDTYGGFSGFGVADSGGVMWAAGYRRDDVGATLTHSDEHDAEERVA